MQIGIIANPESGKDVRRLTSGASISSTHEKVAVVRRFLTGFTAFCDAEIHYFDDLHRITKSALDSLRVKGVRIDLEPEGTSNDSTGVAKALEGIGLLVTLGGDGTNRAIAKGWNDAPLLTLSTGTNNAFASLAEPTVAGIAAAFIVNEALPLASISTKSKLISVQIDGESDSDLALVDLVATRDQFVGARAIVEPSQYLFAILTQANASRLGMVGVAGSLDHVDAEEDDGIFVTFNENVDTEHKTKAAVAPGLIRTVNISSFKRIPLRLPIVRSGPAVLAFDGERERYLRPSQDITCSVQRSGPRLFDVEAAMREISLRGLFRHDYKRVLAHA